MNKRYLTKYFFVWHLRAHTYKMTRNETSWLQIAVICKAMSDFEKIIVTISGKKIALSVYFSC